MSWFIENLEISSTIWANIITIVWWFWWILALFYFFWNKKYKAINVSSKTFQIPIEKEDIKTAIRPRKIYDETIDIQYDKTKESPKEFCKRNTSILTEIKEKYNPICVFGIAEMFIFIWIWYYLQDSVHIKWFRKLKENITKFWWNPQSWTGFLSLKWRLAFKWRIKACKNSYNDVDFNFNGNEIALILNISYNIKLDDIPTEIKKLPLIKFWIKKADTWFLINESQVHTFSKKIKYLMHNLDQKLWKNGKIHILGSLPVPFCIKLWQSIHRNWPECIIYDLNENKDYVPVISTKDFII